MKRINIKILGTFMSIATMVGGVMPVMAAEQAQTISCDENIKSMIEQTGQLEIHALPEKIGDSIVIGEDENGILSVTLIDESQSQTRSSTVTSRTTYLFQYETILGTKKDAYEVSLICDWVKAGADSKIIELRGTAQALDSAFSCAWSDSYYSTCNCWLELVVVKGIGFSAEYRFIATVFPMEDLDDLTFGYIQF